MSALAAKLEESCLSGSLRACEALADEMLREFNATEVVFVDGDEASVA